VTRLAWRQFRTSGVVAAAALVTLAALAAVTGVHLLHLYRTTVAGCGATAACSVARAAFLRTDSSVRVWLGVIVVVVPGVTGVFWGAPLVAGELEAGTHRLAWTQSVTRTRWLAVKLVVVGVASVAVVGFLSLVVTWWASPLDRVRMDQFATFDQRDIVVVGYAAFAFGLGVTAGILWRRTLAAMATTMVAFLAVRLSFDHLVRAHLIAPQLHSFALDPASTGYGSSGTLFSPPGAANLQPTTPNIPNAWITSSRIIDHSGHPLTTSILNTMCPGIGGGSGGAGPSTGAGLGGGSSRSPVPANVQQALQDCVSKVGTTFHQVVSYQPASRYWPLQWYELAIYVAAALVLGGLSLWWVSRRLG
jgi:hypothetical protein